MKTVISTMDKNGKVTELGQIDFNEVVRQGISDDPIAYFMGGLDRKLGKKLPSNRSEEYKNLAPEYKRGYKENFLVVGVPGRKK